SLKLSPKGFRKEVSKGWLLGWLSGHVACSEDESEGGVSKGLRGDFRQGFGLVPEGFSVRLRGHVSDSEGSERGLSGWHVPKVFSKEVSKGGSSGMTLIVGVGINGCDSSMRSDRG